LLAHERLLAKKMGSDRQGGAGRGTRLKNDHCHLAGYSISALA